MLLKKFGAKSRNQNFILNHAPSTGEDHCQFLDPTKIAQLQGDPFPKLAEDSSGTQGGITVDEENFLTKGTVLGPVLCRRTP